MQVAPVSRLKAKLSEHIARVKRGEEVLITERGKPVARLVPVGPGVAEDQRLRDLVARGVVRPGTGNWAQLLADLPICRVPEGTVERLIDEEREDRV